MAWSDAARRAAALARRLKRVNDFLRKKDPKSGVENLHRGENFNRARIISARLQAKMTGRKQVARLSLTDYNEQTDTHGLVTVGPRRSAMKGEVRRQGWNYYVGKESSNESLGKLRGTSSRAIAKKARALARAKKASYHSPYS